MSLSVETLAVARKYTDDSLAGAGAVAGVPCKIQSITAITGGNRVTFLWTDNNGDDHTSAMDVMNGVDGEDGKGIQSVSVNAQNHLIITYTDGTTVDAGQIEIHSSVDSVNGQTGAVVLDAEDVGALPDNTPIPSKTSDLTNDSGFATTSDVSTALADYTKTADLTTLLAAKQDTLTFDNVPTENSNNPVKSGGVYSQIQTLTNYVNNGIYYDGAKNLLPLLISKIKAINTTGSWSKSDENDVYTISGVTYTITSNANGVITNIKASGTGASSRPFSDLYITQRNTYDAFAMYELIKNNTLTIATHAVKSVNFILDGQYNDSWKTVQAISGKADITLDISTSNNVQACIRIVADRTVTNEDITPIMAQKSLMDIDDSFSPYAKTNQQLTEDTTGLLDNTEVNGAVNMLNFSRASEVKKGYTFTNTDGVVTVTGSRASGETGNVDYYVDITLPKGTYKVSGCPSGGSENTWRLLVNINDGAKYAFDYGDGAEFTLTEESSLRVYCTIMANYSDTVNLTFYPMITVPSYNGDYVPYAKSNKELTEKIDIVGNLFTTTTKVVDNITHNIATTVATLGNLPIGTYVVSGQFNSDSAMSGGGLIQFASSGVIQNGASCNPIINQGFKANAGLTGIFNVTNATNQINLQIYTANADLSITSVKLAAIRIA